jgi:hypothetical protein
MRLPWPAPMAFVGMPQSSDPPAKSRRPVPALSAYLSNPDVSCVLATTMAYPVPNQTSRSTWCFTCVLCSTMMVLRYPRCNWLRYNVRRVVVRPRILAAAVERGRCFELFRIHLLREVLQVGRTRSGALTDARVAGPKGHGGGARTALGRSGAPTPDHRGTNSSVWDVLVCCPASDALARAFRYLAREPSLA